MRVPHPSKLQSQTFNSKKLEFVWQFDDQQFIVGVEPTGVYTECGVVNSAGDYIGPPVYRFLGSHFEDFVNEATPIRIQYPIRPEIITDDFYWNDLPGYNFFVNGKELVPLIEDAIEYLK